MKPKQSAGKTRKSTHPVVKGREINELVKPGEIKEIWEGTWIVNTTVVLDPPEPIKKRRKAKNQKK